jgi:NAD(P)-dependent dehydrogenase (short-subunit alcohol dehydrogenase family)
MQDALTRNLARQYALHSVRVIGVNPAWVDTEAPAQMAAQLQVWPPPSCGRAVHPPLASYCTRAGMAARLLVWCASSRCPSISVHTA